MGGVGEGDEISKLNWVARADKWNFGKFCAAACKARRQTKLQDLLRSLPSPRSLGVLPSLPPVPSPP